MVIETVLPDIIDLVDANPAPRIAGAVLLVRRNQQSISMNVFRRAPDVQFFVCAIDGPDIFCAKKFR